MGGERVLIVEDEKLLRWSLRERLGREGYQVLEAATGQEGVALLESPGADLLLLDLRLPDMTGIDLLRRIAPTRADMPVILMTAYSTEQTAAEAIRLGAVDSINKPFAQDEMAAIVRKALEARRSGASSR